MGAADQQHADWLARSPARAGFEPLRQTDLDALDRVGEWVALAPGTHLFREGEQPVAAYFIEDGEVEICRGRGQRRRVVGRAGPGALLGDVAMFKETLHIADARVTHQARARRFPRARLLPELAVNPGILLRWMVAIIRRLEDSQRRVVGLMYKTVLAQVADLLMEESSRQPDVNLSQSTVAALLGVSRQSVNEALGLLREQGVVETGYRRITILDPTRLEEVSGSGRFAP